MARYSVAVRSLALAGLGFGAVPAFAQSANVTAFNPYSGVGTAGGPAATSVYAVPQGAAGGMAFNPWNPSNVAAGWGTPSVGAVAAPSYGTSSYGSGSYSGTNLPEPPPGPIESRLTAVPQPGDRSSASARRIATPAPEPSPPPPAPVVARVEPPAPAPVPIQSAPVAVPAPAPAAPPPAAVAAPAPPPPAAVVTPAPAPAKVASVPPPPEPAAPPAPRAAPLTSVTFGSQSAEIGASARTDLDRAAQSMKGVRSVELRAYAGGPDPTEARKVALARALAVRSYLIDQGVRTRIEVGAFASTDGGGERVDVLVP